MSSDASILDLFRLDDQVAVIAGAGRGIGAAVARAMAEAGADVVIAARTAAELEATAAHIAGLGQDAHVVVADLSDPGRAGALADAAAERFGRLDIVVNNLGSANPQPFLETTPEDLERAFSFNVSTAHALIRAAVPHMLSQGGGAVVNISSAMGHYAGRGFTAYSAAKGAFSHYTRAAAQDLSPQVRVNAIAPASVATDAVQSILVDDTVREAMLAATPLRRIAEPEEIGAAAVYLASPAAAFVTGTILEITGGTQQPNVTLPLADL